MNFMIDGIYLICKTLNFLKRWASRWVQKTTPWQHNKTRHFQEKFESRPDR